MPSPIRHFPGAPEFFTRTWIDGLVIFGYSRRSDYVEDQPREHDVWERRRAFPSQCFSVVEAEGEWGFTPLSEVREITAEQFDEARLRGWRASVA